MWTGIFSETERTTGPIGQNDPHGAPEVLMRTEQRPVRRTSGADARMLFAEPGVVAAPFASLRLTLSAQVHPIPHTDSLPNKDLNLVKKKKKKIITFDLHGYSLDDANKKVREIILSCLENKYKEILFITGKGLHSTNEKDVYTSKEFGKLKFSVPEFIKSNQELSRLIKSVDEAEIKDGGEGAILIKLKNL